MVLFSSIGNSRKLAERRTAGRAARKLHAEAASTHAGEISKRSSLCPRLRLPSTLIRQENGAFRKRFINRMDLKMPSFRFRVDGKHFENGVFRKRWRYERVLKGGLPIPFPSHLFFPNPTNQCPDPTDILTKHQSYSHFGFFSDSNPCPSDRNPIFPVQKQENPNSHFTPSGTTYDNHVISLTEFSSNANPK